MAMIVAETLGLSATDVNPMVADTDSIAYTDGTGGSRVCYATGHACYLAAEDIKERMCIRAAKQMELEEGDVEFVDGNYVARSDRSKKLTFKEIAEQQGSTGGPIEGCGTINAPSPGNAFATHIVDVEVDPETGKVTILRYTAVQDVGKAIHPVTWKVRYRVVSFRESAGLLLRGISTTTTARWPIPRFWTTACPRHSTYP